MRAVVCFQVPHHSHPDCRLRTKASKKVDTIRPSLFRCSRLHATPRTLHACIQGARISIVDAVLPIEHVFDGSKGEASLTRMLKHQVHHSFSQCGLP